MGFPMLALITESGRCGPMVRITGSVPPFPTRSWRVHHYPHLEEPHHPIFQHDAAMPSFSSNGKDKEKEKQGKKRV